jgi:FMN reductase
VSAIPEGHPQIRVAAVIGSVREDSYTAKAVALLGDEFRSRYPDVVFDPLDPRHLDLRGPGLGGGDAEVAQQVIGQATGVVLATPEYHGSYSSVLKLVIENLGFPSGLHKKPVIALGVAAGAIGAIKALEHLGSVVTHVGGHLLPGSVSVAGVQDVFDESGNCVDAQAEERIRGVATKMMDYIHEYVIPHMCMEAMVRE